MWVYWHVGTVKMYRMIGAFSPSNICQDDDVELEAFRLQRNRIELHKIIVVITQSNCIDTLSTRLSKDNGPAF